MKVLRALLLVVLIGLLGMGILLAVAFIPAVQKRIFLAAASSADRTVSVERVSAGLQGVAVDGLRVREGENEFSVERVRVVAPLAQFVFSRRAIDVEEVTVDGLKLDLVSMPAAPTDKSAPAGQRPVDQPSGEHEQPVTLQLPRAVHVAKVSVEGQLLLPDEGRGRPHGSFSLSGGGFGPDGELELVLKGRWADPAQPGLAEGMEIDGEITAHATEANEIDRAVLQLRTPLASGRAEFAAPAGRLADANLQADFTADLARLVVFVPAAVRPPLTAGTLRQDIKARQDVDGTLQAEGSLEVSNLSGGPNRAVHQSLAAGFSASVPKGGPATIDAHGAATPGGDATASDFALTGTVLPPREGGALTVDLKLVSKRIAVAGLTTLAEILTPTDDSAAPTEPGETEAPDTVPAWDGLAGRIAFEAGEVLLPEGATMRNVQGVVGIEGNELRISGLKGYALESPFTGDLTLGFGDGKGGYHLAGNVDLEGFDAGKALQSLDSGAVPQIEGVFATRATIKTSGGTLAALADQPSASVSIRGTEGVFRGLKRAADNTASVIGLIGSLTGNREATELSQLAGSLASIPYEEIAVDATVAGDRSVHVQTFRLRGSNVILEGAGSLKPSETASFLRWPLSLELGLQGKGRLAQLLQSLRVAAPQPNEQGFTALRFPFQLEGSLSAPDAGDLWRNMAKLTATSLLDSRRSNRPTPEPQAAPSTQAAPSEPGAAAPAGAEVKPAPAPEETVPPGP